MENVIKQVAKPSSDFTKYTGALNNIVIICTPNIDYFFEECSYNKFYGNCNEMTLGFGKNNTFDSLCFGILAGPHFSYNKLKRFTKFYFHWIL